MIKKKNLSKEDKKIWDNYIKNPSDIFDKEQGKSKKNSRKDRYKFDLHGFSLDDANNRVRELIIYCSEKNYKEILLITGKGIHSTNENDIYISKDFGKLRFSVPQYLKSNVELNKLIISVKEAEIKDGGDGALIIKLKNL